MIGIKTGTNTTSHSSGTCSIQLVNNSRGEVRSTSFMERPFPLRTILARKKVQGGGRTLFLQHHLPPAVIHCYQRDCTPGVWARLLA
jgi:hypothetical protein